MKNLNLTLIISLGPYWHCSHKRPYMYTFFNQILPPDIWHVTHDGGWTFSQHFSYLALIVWDLWCLEELEETDDSPTQLMTKLFVEHPSYTIPYHTIAYYSKHLSLALPSLYTSLNCSASATGGRPLSTRNWRFTFSVFTCLMVLNTAQKTWSLKWRVGWCWGLLGSPRPLNSYRTV